MAWTRHPNAYQEPPPPANHRTPPGKTTGQGIIAARQALSPWCWFQKWRWVHFPFHADLPGKFVYRVTPVFMDENDILSYGEAQDAAIELARETYPGQLNVAFTRGFVSSQAFVDRFGKDGPISMLLPARADAGLTFVPSHPDAAAALGWMGFEAHNVILELLDQAIADVTTQVYAVAYDLNEPEVVDRLEKLGTRLTVIIDNSGAHGKMNSAETAAASRLTTSAGAAQVKRQHMADLQHNKSIVVTGPKLHTKQKLSYWTQGRLFDAYLR